MAPATSKPLGRTYFSRTTAIVVVLISLTVLTGWFWDIDYLKSVMPDYPSMKPNTAVAFVFTAFSLLCFTFRSRGARWIDATVIFGVVVYLIGSLTLAEYILGKDFGIDQLLLPVSETGGNNNLLGRMSPHSALNFSIIGVTLALLTGKSFIQRVSEFLTFAVLISTFGSFLGHLYGAEQLYGISNYNSMAIHTGGLFFLSSLGLLAVNPNSQITKLLISGSLGGKTARKLLPTVILVPTIVGWLRVIGQERGLYDTGFGSALTIFVCVVLMFSLVLFFCSAIHRTDKRRLMAEEEIKAKERRYRDLFDYGQGMICIHDLAGVIITVNPATFLSLGYEIESMVGNKLSEFLPAENKHQFEAYLRKVVNEGLASGYFSLIGKDGKVVVWRYHNILVSEPDAEPYILGHAQDVTELLSAQKQLKNLSVTDELTGLYNRRGFTTMAEQQIRLERHEGTARGLTLMFADMDGLKKINDIYGHEAGSNAIIALSKIFTSALRDSDLVARWGGDEFVILAIGSQDKNAELMSERINRMLDEYNAQRLRPYKLACSIGVAPIPLKGNRSFENILAEADEAMYAEKRRRKATDESLAESEFIMPPNSKAQSTIDLRGQNPLT